MLMLLYKPLNGDVHVRGRDPEQNVCCASSWERCSLYSLIHSRQTLTTSVHKYQITQ